MPDEAQWQFEAIGSHWQIDTASPLGPEVRSEVTALIDEFDRNWSRFRDDGTVGELRSRAGRHRMPDDAAPLLDLYAQLYRLTEGAMSPTVGAGLERLGYDADYSLRPSGAPVAGPDWSRVRWDEPYLVTEEPFVLDVGAAGKGYLADRIADVLARTIDGPFTVDGSGDLVRSGPAIRVALEHPLDPTMAVGVVEVGDAALAGSAVNRRAWGEGLHHVLDARTGMPAGDVIATWVLAADARTADALATALFFVEPQVLLPEFDFQYVVLDRDVRMTYAPDLPAEMFT